MGNVTGPGTVPDRDQEFDRLVDEYQEPVLRMCYLTLCDKTLAEDAAPAPEAADAAPEAAEAAATGRAATNELCVGIAQDFDSLDPD